MIDTVDTASQNVFRDAWLGGEGNGYFQMICQVRDSGCQFFEEILKQELAVLKSTIMDETRTALAFSTSTSKGHKCRREQ